MEISWGVTWVTSENTGKLYKLVRSDRVTECGSMRILKVYVVSTTEMTSDRNPGGVWQRPRWVLSTILPLLIIGWWRGNKTTVPKEKATEINHSCREQHAWFRCYASEEVWRGYGVV